MTGPDYSGAFRALDRSLNDVTRSIIEINNRVEHMQDSISETQGELKSTRGDLLELKGAFESFVSESQRVASVQRAETKIGNLKAELDRQFGHYGTVRRTSVGVLQAFDVANVTDEVVSHVSEELMIQSPGYWLAPALVAVAGWSRNDETIVERSIQEAYRRNAAKTSLFFALILRRTGRNEAALRWLAHYLKNSDPRHLTREFAVILEASAQGAFGPHGAEQLSQQLKVWNDTLRMNLEVIEQQVSEWAQEIRNNAGQLADDEYPALKAFSPTYNQLKWLLESASALGRTATKYNSVKDSSYSAPGLVADLLDDLLEQLVTEYDDEELPLRREVAFNQAIIDTDGDKERADTLSSQYVRALEESVDAVAIQTRTAISPESYGVSVRTQNVSIGAGQKDFLEGIKKYTREYRGHFASSAQVVLGPEHSPQANMFNFVGHQSTTDEPEEAVVARLRGQWDETFATYINSVSFRPLKFIIAGVALALVSIMFMVSGSIVPGLGLLILGGVGVGIWAMTNKQKSERLVAEAESQREQAFEFSRARLLETRANFTDLMLEYNELDSDENTLVNLIQSWPTAPATTDSK